MGFLLTFVRNLRQSSPLWVAEADLEADLEEPEALEVAKKLLFLALVRVNLEAVVGPFSLLVSP